MVNQRSKRHHHVPQTLQKRFLNTRNRVWYAKRETVLKPFPAIEDRNPSSCFWNRNFYTVLEDAATKSDKVERGFFGPVDDHLARLLDEIEAVLAIGKLPVFKNAKLNSLNNLMIALFKRSTDAAGLVDERESGLEIHEAIVGQIDHRVTEELAPTLRTKIPSAVDLGRHARVMAQVTESKELQSAMQDYDVSFVIPEGRGSFILGSKMIYRIGNGSTDVLGSENVELWFPISSKCCLVRHHRNLRPAGVYVWPDYAVRQFNSSIVSQSLAVAANSKHILGDLLRR